MKYPCFSLIVFVIYSSVAADSAAEQITGSLIKKPWSKSTQSYCAGGSDYFVLRDDRGQEYVLETTRKVTMKRLNALVGNTSQIDGMTVTGYFRFKTITPSHNEIEQYPVTTPLPIEQSPLVHSTVDTPFKCQLFRLERINSKFHRQ